MAAVLFLFAIVKKRGYFKCDKHIYDKQDILTYSSQLSHLRSLMVDKSGIEFKVTLIVTIYQPTCINIFRWPTLSVMLTGILIRWWPQWSISSLPTSATSISSTPHSKEWMRLRLCSIILLRLLNLNVWFMMYFVSF